jgi:hypothetical protein
MTPHMALRRLPPAACGHSTRSPSLTYPTIAAIAVILPAIGAAVASYRRTSRVRQHHVRLSLQEEAESRLLRFRPVPRACES